MARLSRRSWLAAGHGWRSWRPSLRILPTWVVPSTSLDGARQALLTKVDPAAHGELTRIGTSLLELRRAIVTATLGVDRTRARFARDWLSVGAVGRGGQGKSEFLKTLTGLTDREIPAARGGFMTGAPSVIRFGQGPTVAEAELHSEASFLEDVVRPYYLDLKLGAPPTSLSDFAREPLPDLPPGSQARDEAAYRHLRDYHDHLSDFRPHLESGIRVRSLDPEDIVRFVAQHDGTGTPTHDFRAVRQVTITTQFGNDDLGRLSVVDLPGLGDTNLRDQHVLRRALDGAVDVAVFVRRPDPLRDAVQDYDVALYDVAMAAVPELPLDRWSFVLLNHVQGEDGGNTAMIGPFAEALRASRLRVVDVLTADCTDRAAVEAAFDRIVEHAVTVIDGLDRALLDQRRQEADVVRAEAERLVREATALSGRSVPSGTWFPHFVDLFNDVHRHLAVGLERLVREAAEEVTAPDQAFQAEIKRTVAKARSRITAPTIEQIEELRDVRGSYRAALADVVDQARAGLSREFLVLEDALHARVVQMQQLVSGVLRDDGRLGTLGPEQGRDFLQRLAEQVNQVPAGTGELSAGLRFVRDFTLNYRGFVQHRVRRSLAKLDPDIIDIAPEARAADIEYVVAELVEEVLFDIETELEQMVTEPNEAVFAVIEEFRDRVLRAQGALDEWRVVYEAVRADVWADEFEVLAANTALFTRWRAAVSRLAASAGSAR